MPRKLTKEEAQRIAKLRHSKMTKEQKSLHAVKMNDARWGRGIIPKEQEVEIAQKDK